MRMKGWPGGIRRVISSFAARNRRASAGFADVNLIIKVAMHFRQITGVAFDAVNFYPPVFSLIAGWVAFGFEDVRVFPKQMAPFSKAHADIQNRLRLKLPQQMDDGRN